jgi:hypothetical protein
MMTEATIQPESTNDDGASEKPATKEKLTSIMEAASALTALGDEESESDPAKSPSKESANEPAATDSAETASPSKEQQIADEAAAAASNAKRYLPEHKKPDAAPTFPEKVSNNNTSGIPVAAPVR